MKETITLKKLAEMLNLSIATVSRALKDHPDISEQTRNRVKELAELIDYNPNPYAINLRTSNSKEFAIIVPILSNRFYHSFISSVEEEARQYGYSVSIYCSNDDAALENDILKRCRQKRMTGIFVAITPATTDTVSFKRLESTGVPVIFFDKVPDQDIYNKACVADKKAAMLAAQALIQRKKKRILALFDSPLMSITRTRLEGFTEIFAAQAPDIQVDIRHVVNSETARQVVAEVLDNAPIPDAIFCMSDEILIGVMKAQQRTALRFPDDIGIIAISDGFVPQLYFPEITYVETSGYKLGKLAFSRMMACLAGSSFAQTLIVDSILIEGGSL